MRLYLDNCCFNRPFDDQSQIRIRLETEAKLFVQAQIARGTLELAWSYILDYENSFNPFAERRDAITRWKAHAVLDTDETPAIVLQAETLHERGIKSKDALHVACAVAAGCDVFLTTDDLLLKRLADEAPISALNPLDFIRQWRPL